jgi:hypothetical protein
MPLGLLPMSPYTNMFEPTKFFTCRVHELHVEIIKRIQANNKQYKFQVECHKSFNIEDCFIIDIIQYTKRHQCLCYCLPRYKALWIGAV